MSNEDSPVRRVDDFDRLVSPIYIQASGTGAAAGKARARLEDMRARLDRLIDSLDRPSAGKLADWAQIRLMMIKAGESTSGDAAADARIRELGPLGTDTLKAWIDEGRALIRQACKDGKNREAVPWAAAKKAGLAGFKRKLPKRKQSAITLMQVAEKKAANGLTHPNNWPEYDEAIEELKDVNRAMLTAALKEYTDYAERHWLASKGEKRGKVPPSGIGL